MNDHILGEYLSLFIFIYFYRKINPPFHQPFQRAVQQHHEKQDIIAAGAQLVLCMFYFYFDLIIDLFF